VVVRRVEVLRAARARKQGTMTVESLRLRLAKIRDDHVLSAAVAPTQQGADAHLMVVSVLDEVKRATVAPATRQANYRRMSA